jgi:phospholipase C
MFAAALAVAQAQQASQPDTENQTPQFKHIVMVIQENRTPDNLFGSNPTFEPGVDISNVGVTFKTKTKGLPNDYSISLIPTPIATCFDELHWEADWIADYDNGKMDGFEKPNSSAICPNTGAYAYIDNSLGVVQPYFNIATQYGFANRMFQTNQGPSYPAHQFLFSGSSAPSDTSDLFVDSSPAGTNAWLGCAAPAGSTVQTIDPNHVIENIYPCFNRSTLPQLIEAAGLTWRYYAASANSLWNAPNSIDYMCIPATRPNGKSLYCAGTEWNNNVSLKPSSVLTDIQGCTLANVVWVTPTGDNSDHAKANNGTGPAWVASIINAIGSNPKCADGDSYWQDTAILITWDDWGGWYDHVPPPTVIGQPNGWGKGFTYGFRVPLLVVSAFTPPGYVSNATHDFGSMLKFTEDNFNLGLVGPGTFADSYADNLQDFFTLTTPTTFLPIPTSASPADFINDLPVDPSTTEDTD